MGIKAIIFDMDGLLIDSMLHWIELDKEFFATQNKEFDPEYVRKLTGHSQQECMTIVKEYFDLSDKEVRELFLKKKKYVNDIYTVKTDIMPGVQCLVDKIKVSSFKQAIASGSPLHDITKVVNRFKWRDHFDELISADHVGEVGKPDPAIYVHTAECLQVDPKDCVVFEDAENGVKAAKDAGMSCIAVPDERWSFGNFDKADLIVDSLQNKKVFDYLKL